MSVNNNIKTADIICEFLEVTIHNILFIRNLYPPEIFSKTKKYGIIVYQSIHPQLNKYIVECIKAIHFHLKTNHLKGICICIMLSRTIVERYVLDILSCKATNVEDLYVYLEQSLRDFCLKLQMCNNYLDKLPEGASFIIQLSVSESSLLEFNENSLYCDFPWIQVTVKDSPSADIVPLHTIETDVFKIQTYIEKQKTKS